MNHRDDVKARMIMNNASQHWHWDSRKRLAAVSAMLVLAVMTTQPARAAGLTTLYSFCAESGCPDGTFPRGLVQGIDGNFYGTTFGGGSNNLGTVFKITPGGTLTTLYSFCALSGCADGQGPIAPLIRGTDGNFYGTTGGSVTNSRGTVFKITPGGTLTTLYRFCARSGCADGANPGTSLVEGTDGNFYGTTNAGGAGIGAAGTVFRITPGGTLTTLHSFCVISSHCDDGTDPLGPLVQGADGNFYGTTAGGGAAIEGLGTVFRITPGGALTTLYSFCVIENDCPDGDVPAGPLVQGTDGNFYGTATGGGTNNQGTVFKITPGGALTTLYADGRTPDFLVKGADGNFYGTMGSGARSLGGSVFKITPGGALTTLYTFCALSACADGQAPNGLVQGTDGNFYGTTIGGGSTGHGTVFMLGVASLTIASTLPAGQAGMLYPPPGQTAQLISGGTGSYMNLSAVTGLPAGLTVTPSGTVVGTISGQVPDRYQITVGAVTDTSGATTATSPNLSSLEVYCGNPLKSLPGDDRDTLIREYLIGPGEPYPGGVIFHNGQNPPASAVPPLADSAPHCDDFASNQDTDFTSHFPTYFAINSKNPTYAFNFTIVDEVLTGHVPVVPLLSSGLDAWVNAIHAAGDPALRTIESAYRNPTRNAALSSIGSSPTSQHMLGDAVDMQLHGPFDTTSWTTEWNLVVHAARLAGADWWESIKPDGTPTGPCVIGGTQHCVHADWRLHRGQGYVNP